MTQHEYLQAKRAWQALRNEIFEISAWEAKEERIIQQAADAKRGPLFAEMRRLERVMSEYRRANHAAESMANP
jgi:hypothetical protein